MAVTDNSEETVTDLATKPQTDPHPGDEVDHDVEIDPALLTEARWQLGAVSTNRAINEGLKLVVERERARRRRAMEAVERMVEEGLLDLDAIDRVDE